MSIANPAINPPRLPSNEKHTLHSRSPSRSPVRHARVFSQDSDPLFRDLSPTSTLRAFTASSQDATGKSQDQLARSIASASNSQKALGVRVAQACRDIRAWSKELSDWEWPGTFDMPERAAKRMRMSAMSFGSIVSDTEAEDDEEYSGGLPSKTVQAYDEQIDGIREELERMNVEEMKEHVLNVHIQPNSRRTSLDNGTSAANLAATLNHMDDFTALVTATILQALPYLSRLNQMLTTWTVRLAILRSTPGYLSDLRQARTDLDHGWAAIAVSPSTKSSDQHASFSRDTMMEMKNVIEHQVSTLGRQLDSMLDDLEGREETVPEAWIEDFESLESAYGDWVVQAEQKVLEIEWRTSTAKSTKLTDRVALALPSVSEDQGSLIQPASAEEQDANELQSRDRTVNNKDLQPEPNPPGGSQVDLLEQDAADAVAFFSQTADVQNAESATRSRDVSDVSTTNESDSRVASPAGERSVSPVGNWIELPREDSQTLPQPQDEIASAPVIREDSNEWRPRHVPIVLEYDGDGQQYPATGVLGGSARQPSPLAIDRARQNEPAENGSGSKVRSRAAFLNTSLEQTQSLQKQVKSPVRPFEHASSAFTRLFSKSRSPEQSRASSTSSRSQSSQRKPLSPVPTGNKHYNFASPRDSDKSFVTAAETAGKHDSAIGDTGIGMAVDDRDDPANSVQQTLSAVEDSDTAEETRDPATAPLDSPFSSPTEQHFAENWPLVSPIEEEAGPPKLTFNSPEGSSNSGPEVQSPKQALESNFFERMFVDSFPNTPEEQASTSPSKEQNPMEKAKPVNLRPIVNYEPSLDDTMLVDDYGRQSGASLKTDDPSSPFRPHHIDLPDPATSARPVSPISEKATPGSMPSGGSDPSSAEIIDASSVGYFKAKEVQASPAVSRTSSTATTRNGNIRPRTAPPLSPMLLKLKIPDTMQSDRSISPSGEQSDIPADDKKPSLIKRASVASLESFPRSELKTIEVPRSGSMSSVSSIVTPIRSAHRDREPRTPGSPVSVTGLDIFQTPSRLSGSQPVSPTAASDSAESPSVRRYSTRPTSPLATEVPRAPLGHIASQRKSPKSPAGPLNAAMAKRRGTKTSGHEVHASDASAEESDAPGAKRNDENVSPIKSLKNPPTPLKPGEDQFDRQVSTVLESLPARIRFSAAPSRKTKTPEKDMPQASADTRPRQSRVPSSKGAAAPSMTIAPAGPTMRNSAADPEIKLYHLTESGFDQPIKLFVRLVGAGERVMVRVGGGWADLGEYLRQYAEHHGRRTVSESVVEVQSGNKRVGAEQKSRPSASRPGSSMAVQRPGSSHATPMPARFTMGDSDTPTDTDADSVAASPIIGMQTPTNTIRTINGTPNSTSTKADSRPSTAEAARPSSRQSWNEIGLAGPSSNKRAELPEQKARWVEDMIERAKKASAEKSKDVEKEKPWNEMGKVGGTRRVIFRQGTGTSTGGVADVSK